MLFIYDKHNGLVLVMLTIVIRSFSVYKLCEFFPGTEVETRAFMAICVETLNRYFLH